MGATRSGSARYSVCTSATSSLRMSSQLITGPGCGDRSVCTVAEAVTVSEWCGSSTSNAVTCEPQ